MPKFNYEATGIGSLPFKDSKKACRIIFDNFKNIPFWPQLPKRSYLEHMYCQFSEGLPGAVINESAKTIYVDSAKSAAGSEKTYQKFLEGDTGYFKISEAYAEGFYSFCGDFKERAKKARFVKGHITGPLSFALSVTDENKKALIYSDEVFDLLLKTLCMKARWQVGELKKLNPNVIIFIDEPYLVSIGSSFVNIPQGAVAKSIDEVAAAIKDEGAVSGIHCCGNTDWPLLFKRGIDIINFDAYNFIREFLLYPDDIKSFLGKGGTIAWGIVPSSEAVDKENTAAVAGRLKAGLKLLSDKGISEKLSSMITPSCGLGTLDEKRAEKIIELTKSIEGFLNER